MASTKVLANRIDINVGGQGIVPASGQPTNFFVNADKSSIVNYSRKNGNLIVKFENGKTLKIEGFFAKGLNFNNLVFIDQTGKWLTRFDNALSIKGDGIVDPEVYYEEIKDDSGAALLAILGVTAAAGAIAAVIADDDDPVVRLDRPVFRVIDDREPVVGILLDRAYTNDTTPTFEGENAAPNGTITITIDGHDPITVKVNPDGTWSYTLPFELADGMYQVTVTQQDSKGNVSDASTIVFTVDTSEPETPVLQTVYDNVDPDIGFIPHGGVTNDKTPTFSGTGEPNSLIRVYDENGNVVGHTFADEDGNWSIELSEDLGEGEHSLTVTSTDPAGNESGSTPPFNLIVDTTSPDLIDERAMDLVDDVGPITGTIAKGGVTDDARPTYSGVTDPENAYVEIFDNGQLIGTAMVQPDGTWNWTPDRDLADGSHSFSARGVDAAGNTGPLTDPWQFTVDTAAPLALDEDVLDLYDDVGLVTGTILRGSETDDNRPTFSGEAGSVDPDDVATINIYDNGRLIGSTKVQPDGSWSFEPSPPLNPGNHNFQAAPVDAAGNEGPKTAGWAFTLVGDAPAPPAIQLVMDDEGSKTGPLQKGDRTDDTTPTISGTGTAGTTVIICVNGVEHCTTEVGSDGTWSVTIDPPLDGDGLKNITAKARDGAGQESPETGQYPIYLDTTAPARPDAPTAVDDAGDKTGPILDGDTTDDTTPMLSGKGEAGGLVEIYDNGKKIGSAIADGSGNWSFTPELEDGDHSLTVTITDQAGNKSAESDPLAFTVDTSDVIVSILRAIDDAGAQTGNLANGAATDDTTPTLVGAGTPGVTVTVYDENGEVVGSAVVGANCAWRAELIPQDEGTHTYKAVAENLAGTIGEAFFTLTIDTTAPDIPTIGAVEDDVGAIQGALANGDKTDDTTPTLSGSGRRRAM